MARPGAHYGIGPELKSEKIKAKCPKCACMHIIKYADRDHHIAYTGTGTPRIYCNKCQNSLFRYKRGKRGR